MDVHHLDRDMLEVGWWNFAAAISVVQDCKLDGVTHHSERIVAVVATRMDLGEGQDDDIVAGVALGFQDRTVAQGVHADRFVKSGASASATDTGCGFVKSDAAGRCSLLNYQPIGGKSSKASSKKSMGSIANSL